MTYAMLTLPDGEEIVGSTLSDIVDRLIPGYGDLPEGPESYERRLLMRAVTLANVAEKAQAIAVAALTAEVPDAVEQLSEDALTALFHDRHSQVLAIEHWDSDIPLFLPAGGYTPYTDLPRPAGETVVILDPWDERTFITGILAAGFGELFITRDDDDDAPDADEADAGSEVTL